jgi:hypothetical protein
MGVGRGMRAIGLSTLGPTTMTKEQAELHERMNAAIYDALNHLLYDFDVEEDLHVTDWQVIRGNIKEKLLKSYAKTHSWINEK